MLPAPAHATPVPPAGDYLYAKTATNHMHSSKLNDCSDIEARFMIERPAMLTFKAFSCFANVSDYQHDYKLDLINSVVFYGPYN